MVFLIAAVLSLGIGVTLGMLGGGGSMLTLPMLVYVLDVAPASAISASLFVVCVTSATGALAHARAGRVVWRVGAIFGLAGMAGAYAGGHFARFIPVRVVLPAFGLVMLLTSFSMMFGRREQEPTPLAAASGVSVLRSIAIGTGVGALSGVVGAGGGFLIVPALESAGGLALPEAIGTSPLITAIQSLAGFAGRLGHVDLDWRLIGVMSGLSVIGCVGGARTVRYLSPRSLRRSFAWLILGMALLLLAKQVPESHLGLRRSVDATPGTRQWPPLAMPAACHRGTSCR
jgi:uncharacterized protein